MTLSSGTIIDLIVVVIVGLVVLIVGIVQSAGHWREDDIKRSRLLGQKGLLGGPSGHSTAAADSRHDLDWERDLHPEDAR
jgi:hypothetical protein